MAKLHFRPYIPNQTVLFSQRIDETFCTLDDLGAEIASNIFSE